MVGELGGHDAFEAGDLGPRRVELHSSLLVRGDLARESGFQAFDLAARVVELRERVFEIAAAFFDLAGQRHFEAPGLDPCQLQLGQRLVSLTRALGENGVEASGIGAGAFELHDEGIALGRLHVERLFDESHALACRAELDERCVLVGLVDDDLRLEAGDFGARLFEQGERFVALAQVFVGTRKRVVALGRSHRKRGARVVELRDPFLQQRRGLRRVPERFVALDDRGVQSDDRGVTRHHRVVARPDRLVVLTIGDIPFRKGLVALELGLFAERDVLVALAQCHISARDCFVAFLFACSERLLHFGRLVASRLQCGEGFGVLVAQLIELGAGNAQLTIELFVRAGQLVELDDPLVAEPRSRPRARLRGH